MLFKKAMRAMWSNKKAYLACVFLISTGILIYTAMNIAVDGLESAVSNYYKDYNLADVYSKVDAMPVSFADSFLDIDGIAALELRYVVETRVELPKSDEVITMRLISVNTDEDMRLNDLLVTGSYFSDENDIIVNPTFFEANELSFGDNISIFVNGMEYFYSICATGLSPENTYITKSAIELLPDESGFGVGYITADSMASLTNSTGLANDIVFKLENGYSFDDVKIQLEDYLAPFGLKELIDKKDHLSYAFVEQEVTSIRSVSMSLPLLFIFMAIVVLYLMMKRVIEQDRTQIGTLKAFGYSNLNIILHYLLYGGITGFAGGVFGYLFGYILSGMYLTMFLQFFLLPGIPNDFKVIYLFNALFIAVAGGLAGSFMGAFKVIKLNPAEAMRPESPRAVKWDFIGRVKILRFILTARGNMALRNIIRNWIRSGFVVIGVMFSFGILCLAGSFNSLIDKVILSQFTDIQLYDVKITLEKPLDYPTAVENAYAIDHVTRAEGILEVPVILKNKHLKEGIMVTGISSNSALYKICDTNKKINYQPPTDSVILSNGIADKLNIVAGDKIYISSNITDNDIPIYVSQVIEQNLGSNCYMELQALSNLLEQPAIASSVILNTDNLLYLKDYLKNSSNTYAIDDKESTLQKYRDMMEMYSSVYFILEVMGVLIAFAIIYNTSTIALSERKREYATLRVLGLSINEICEIMNFEYWILSIFAMLLGVPFTLSLNGAMNSMMDTSLYSMPSTLPFDSYLVGIIGCTIAIILSNFSAKRKIKKFDMVEVLKERE